MTNLVSREMLETAELLVDARYEGGSSSFGDDPLMLLLGVGSQGGFRFRGTASNPRVVVLASSLTDPDWPDELDLENGVFTYYGDNKIPGRDLHESKGNQVLRLVFGYLHAGMRDCIPPFFVFTSAGRYRDVVFRGLAVPGVEGLSQYEDLVAVWKFSQGQRFQNYRAKFSILDEPRISRVWLDELRTGADPHRNAPTSWLRWVRGGKANILRAARSVEYRNRSEQMPSAAAETEMLATLLQHFAAKPDLFEACAAQLVRWAIGGVVSIDVTRPSRDGGRDAIGKFQIGSGDASILVDFAVEAKCYDPSNSVGVREMSRLISRLRHRQFGVLVTTSWVNAQAYKEIKEDGHPILVLSGVDLVRTLKANGIGDNRDLLNWLNSTFPLV